ncbi:MAG: amidohydrolase family protein, partial [Verrucomicrobiales bacterium]
DWKTWKPSDLQPYVERVIELFTPERLMFGTDWPVCLLAGSYSQAVEALESALPTLSPQESAGIWGLNAVRFYGLKPT